MLREDGVTKRGEVVYTNCMLDRVCEQQPGVAVRKEILRLRGAMQTNRVRHPGINIQPAVAEQVRSLIAQVLPGVDITRPIAI
jgi:4-hydroxy-tetrahydrodipicolinate synthase